MYMVGASLVLRHSEVMVTSAFDIFVRPVAV